MDLDLEKIRALLQAAEDFDLVGLKVESGDTRISIRRKGAQAASVSYAPAPAAAFAPTPSAAAPAAAPAAQEGTFITSPFVGTFYRAPSPEAAPFAEVGKPFAAGQALCIVEAMKLMNEIEAEYAGEVLEILVENGQPVEYGDKLFRVRKA